MVPSDSHRDPTGHGVPDGEKQFWFNRRTHEVEEGRLSAWGDRMGPYATREEAQHALDLAAARSEAWEEEDRRWRDDWDEQERDR